MNKEFKIYTKTGDKGTTSLIGGTRVPKYDLRIEAYGTVDELNSFIGLIKDQDINIEYKNVLLIVQDRLFTIESLLAWDKSKTVNKLPQIVEEDVLLLESEIDKMNIDLPELHSFILPGGNTTISFCHIARTVCRRTERIVIKLSQELIIEDLVLKYLNRLSDYLFVLSRKIAKDNNINDVLWKAKI